jgi:hypothetical protein
MSNACAEFTHFWREFDPKSEGPGLHPADAASLDDQRAQAAGLQLQLLPLPVNGRLEGAAAVVVMLNSGFSPADKNWDAAHPTEAMEREASKERNLSQTHLSQHRYPLYDLNPMFSEHPGARYWRRKLGGLCSELANRCGIGLHAATELVANRVSIVQRFAYASTNSKHVAQACATLPSTMAAQSLVHGLIEEGEVLVVIVRGATALGLSRNDEAENVVVLDPKTTEPVRAHLGPTSRAGKTLLQHLCASV